MTTGLSVDICIPTWNRKDLLRTCLASLPIDTPGVTVIVADNASTDGTAEMIRSEFPGVLQVPLPENLGFGRAVNAAAEAGCAEIVATVNNDTIMAPDFVPSLLVGFDSPDVGMVAAVMLDETGTKIDAVGIECDRTLQGYSVLHGADPVAIATVGDPLGPCGGAAAYRRSAFDAVGGFDPEIFAYGEDLDLALRLRTAGWTCRLARGARVKHVGGATSGRQTSFQRQHSAFARGYLLGRYRRPWHILGLEILVAVAGGLRSRNLSALQPRLRGWRRGRLLAVQRVPRDCASLSVLVGLRRQLTPT